MKNLATISCSLIQLQRAT